MSEAKGSTKAQHTPGPWTIEDPISEDRFEPIVGTHDGYVICEVACGLPGGHHETRANANLLAAATDLLAELKAADSLAVFIEATLSGVAVPFLPGCHDVSRAFSDIRRALRHTVANRRAAIAKAEGHS